MAEVSYVKFPSDEWLVNIGSCNGLVPAGNKPLPESMLTKIYVYIYNNVIVVTSHPTP